jgi:hypothetical protein
MSLRVLHLKPHLKNCVNNDCYCKCLIQFSSPISSWIDSFQTDQRRTSISHITCWQKGGKRRRSRLQAHQQWRPTGSGWLRSLTWIGLEFSRSRTSRLPPWSWSHVNCPLLSTVISQSSPGDIFVRWVYDFSLSSWILVS